jgi:hypothetical protein
MGSDRLRAAALAPVLVTLLASIGQAQQSAPPAHESADLAAKLSNPISDLVSVPFQFNWEQNVGPSELTRFILNVQPVIPFTLNEDWNMIVRIITPLIGQPPMVDPGFGTFGIGDVTTSFFFSPATSTGFTWGVGPAIVLPSTSEPTLGNRQWCAGPTAVALQQTGPWTFGALGNQVWSFSGDSSRGDVNQLFLQPFLAYQATHTVTLTVQSETTANWEAVGGDRWTIPINFLISKLSSLGSFPASYQVGFGGFPAHPAVGPSWKVRGAIVILLPKTQHK